MSTDYKKLYRSRTNRIISGVCGGLGEFANVDPTLIRLLCAAAILFSGGVFFIFYLVMMLVVPEAPEA